MARDIDPKRLSPEARRTLEDVGVRLAAGLTRSEIASMLGISRHQLARQIARLDRETSQGERRCGNCRELLPPGSRSQRVYCSGRCRVAGHRAGKRDRRS
jgi:hypothetical protein